MKKIDVSGPDGNAFALIAYAKNLAKQLELDPNEIQAEMMAGDYENLLDVFEENFGDYIELVNR